MKTVLAGESTLVEDLPSPDILFHQSMSKKYREYCRERERAEAGGILMMMITETEEEGEDLKI